MYPSTIAKTGQTGTPCTGPTLLQFTNILLRPFEIPQVIVSAGTKLVSVTVASYLRINEECCALIGRDRT